MEPSTARFRSAIDHRHDAGRSVVLRYRNALRFDRDDAGGRGGAPGRDPDGDGAAESAERAHSAFRDLLVRCSIAEGARLFHLFDHRGVAVHVLDETSAMHTGTLKSIDGCVTIAFCLRDGLSRIAFESGGNTGVALTAYGTRMGLETACFVPEENVSLLDGRVFAHERARLVAVADPGGVRAAAERFAEETGYARVPRTSWRIAAARVLGCFLLEQALEGVEFDVLVQTISAGFGPIGIYDVLAAHGARQPRFLGVQQAGNCAMVRAWRAGSADAPAPPVRSTAALLSRVMYDSRPQTYGTYDRLARLVERTRGSLVTIDHASFAEALERHPVGREIVARLASNGVAITRRDGDVVEKTGLLALAGALAEIDGGGIPAGSRVLCCLTSGVARCDVPAVPDERVAEAADPHRDAVPRAAAAGGSHG
ncbi:MAG TPA: pyridoxal-phosphate dependent enzyme [Candidatus Binatia bacterium]|nr:pyridoxal-phosphate dependent enzyme [Candidatus Binatia bacterium]